MNISSTTAQVAPDLSKVQAIISDTSVRRSAVDWEDLNLYWKSEKRPIIFKFFKDFTNFKKKTSWAVVFGHSLKCMIKHSFFQMKGFFLGYLSILLNYERRNRKISKALALIWPKTSMMMHHGHQCAKKSKWSSHSSWRYVNTLIWAFFKWIGWKQSNSKESISNHFLWLEMPDILLDASLGI